MANRVKTLLVAAAMLLPNGTFALKSAKQAVQTDVANTIFLQNTEKERSDTLYLQEKEESHEEIIQIQFDDIIALYGKEKWMEIIRRHFIQEINVMRKDQWLNELQNDSMLDTATQKHADYLHDHANEYDFTGTDKSKSPHIEYDTSGWVVNTPWVRAKQAGYIYSLISENISAIGALRPNNPWTIASVLQEWINEEWHKKNIFSLTKDIWIGYYNGIVVILFAK